MTTKFPPEVTHPWMIVCGVSLATDLLMSTNTAPHIGALISIADVTYGPTQTRHRPPEIGVLRVPRRCVLTFDDVYDDDEYGIAPTREDVARIIKFARAVNANDPEAPTTGRVLIHCFAGVSRSTAAGLIWLAARLGPGREEDAAAELVAACADKDPQPNKTMIKYADEQLGRNGALIAVSEEFYRLGSLLAAKVARGDV